MPVPDSSFVPGRALVLGDHRQSLVVARSLHRAGYCVTLGSAEPPSTLARSRHIALFWQHPPLEDEGTAFDTALARWAAQAADRPLLFPVGDGEVAGIARRAGRLPRGMVSAMADAKVVPVCHDKPALYRIAQQAGLAVPPFELVPVEEIDAAIARVGLPCVVKPASSNDDPGYLKALLFDRVPDTPQGPRLAACGWRGTIVQRKVTGVRHNCHFVAHQGRLLAYFEQSVQRTTRLDGSGNGVDGRSEAPSAARREACERLLRALDYSGPGCVQFLVAHDQAWLLELNPRLDATCAIAVHCGYDLPRLAAQESLHRAALAPLPQPMTQPYPVGRRAVWTTGDLRAFLNELQARRLGPKSALQWLNRTVLSCANADLHLTFAREDPLPALGALAAMTVAPLWRRVKRLMPT